MTTSKDPGQTRGHDYDLDACREAIERLEAEIGLLREASTTFADLAERLNIQLQILRRQLARPAD